MSSSASSASSARPAVPPMPNDNEGWSTQTIQINGVAYQYRVSVITPNVDGSGVEQIAHATTRVAVEAIRSLVEMMRREAFTQPSSTVLGAKIAVGTNSHPTTILPAKIVIQCDTDDDERDNGLKAQFTNSSESLELPSGTREVTTRDNQSGTLNATDCNIVQQVWDAAMGGRRSGESSSALHGTGSSSRGMQLPTPPTPPTPSTPRPLTPNRPVPGGKPPMRETAPDSLLSQKSLVAELKPVLGAPSPPTLPPRKGSPSAPRVRSLGESSSVNPSTQVELRPIPGSERGVSLEASADELLEEERSIPLLSSPPKTVVKRDLDLATRVETGSEAAGLCFSGMAAFRDVSMMISPNPVLAPTQSGAAPKKLEATPKEQDTASTQSGAPPVTRVARIPAGRARVRRVGSAAASRRDSAPEEPKAAPEKPKTRRKEK